MEIISKLIFQIRKIIRNFFVKFMIQKWDTLQELMGSFALMLLFVNRTLYTFCSRLIKYSLLHLGYYKIGMVILQSFFSMSVDKVRLCNFFITRNMVVGSWRGI